MRLEKDDRFDCDFPGRCLMPGVHMLSECYTREMAEEWARETDEAAPNLDAQPDDAPDKVSTFALKLWARLNERRCHLIERNHAGVASDAERIELAQLQILADESIHTFAPLPIAELEAHMKSQGIDALVAKLMTPQERTQLILDRMEEWGAKDIPAEEWKEWVREEIESHFTELEAQLAEANAQRNTVFENMKTQSELVARLRAALEAVETWMAGEEGPLYKLWEDGDICDYDDNPVDKWENVLTELRDFSIDPKILAYAAECPTVTIYRAVLSALSPREEGEGK